MEERENQEQVETVLTENETQKVEEIVETASVKEENAVSTSKKGAKKGKKEKPQECYEGLSDDEIYTKMQTEKLVQRKKKRKELYLNQIKSIVCLERIYQNRRCWNTLNI